MPGADYEALLSELAKYGASLVLATQSLARLEALDRQHAARPAPDRLRQPGRAVRLPLQRRGRPLPGARAGRRRGRGGPAGAGRAPLLRPPLRRRRAPAPVLRAPRPAPGERRPPWPTRWRPRRPRATGATSPPSRPTWRRRWRGHPHPGPRRRRRTPPGGRHRRRWWRSAPGTLTPGCSAPEEAPPLEAPPTESAAPSGAAPRPPGASGAPGARSRNRPRRSRPQPAHPGGTLTLSPPTDSVR